MSASMQSRIRAFELRTHPPNLSPAVSTSKATLPLSAVTERSPLDALLSPTKTQDQKSMLPHSSLVSRESEVESSASFNDVALDDDFSAISLSKRTSNVSVIPIVASRRSTISNPPTSSKISEIEITELLETVKNGNASIRSSAQASVSGAAPFILARLDAEDSSRSNERCSTHLKDEFNKLHFEKAEDEQENSGPVIDWGKLIPHVEPSTWTNRSQISGDPL